MQFGLFGSAQAKRGGPDVDSGQGFKDYVEYNVEAESLGLASTFVVEHHRERGRHARRNECRRLRVVRSRRRGALGADRAAVWRSAGLRLGRHIVALHAIYLLRCTSP